MITIPIVHREGATVDKKNTLSQHCLHTGMALLMLSAITGCAYIASKLADSCTNG